MQTFINSPQVQQVLHLHLPRFGELPTLELYMDQVITVINGTLAPLFPQNNANTLTPTMINNYVKQKIVSPPIKKRYTRNHLVYFFVMALLKPVFSITEIGALIRQQVACSSIDVAYDSFCTRLEHILLQTFETRQPSAVPEVDAIPETMLLHAVIFTLVNKIYVEKFLEYAAKRPPALDATTSTGEKAEG